MIEEENPELAEEENIELPQKKLLDSIYAISLVLGNFYIQNEENEDFGLPVVQGYNLTHPTAKSFNISGINQLVSNGIGLHTTHLSFTHRPYNSSYSITFTNELGENIVSSSAIATSLLNNTVRTDYLLGGGNYQGFIQNISVNANFYWQNFCNTLSGNPLQNINNTPLLQDMLGFYCCEISRCSASLVTVPIFYSMFSNNINIRNAVTQNFENFGLTTNGVQSIINDMNCIIPPIMLEHGTPSANTLINGAGNIFVNDFFEQLDFRWLHDHQQPVRIRFTEAKRFGLLEEILISRWYNGLNNEDQIILNNININGYQGNIINHMQADSLMTSILIFFNENFGMGFNEEDIQDKVNLANDILEHPENTDLLLQEFNVNLIGDEVMELD